MRRRTLLAATPAALATLATASSLTSAQAAQAGSPSADGLRTWVPTGDFASSSFVRVARAAPDPVPGDGGRKLALTAVRGGHVSGQLAVSGAAALKGLRARVTALAPESGGGKALAPGQVRVRYPAFVPDDRGGTVSDPLHEADGVDVAAGDAQPVWFTFTVPADTGAGTYKGRIVLSAQNVQQVAYDLTLTVAKVTLPPAAEQDFHLNVWFQPDTVAVAAGLTFWSSAHFDAMRPYLRDLAEHGQNVVNTVIAEDPWRVEWPDGSWRAQTEEPYHSPVDWTYDGETWSFDFTNWDRLVRAQLDAGIGPYIHAYGLLGFRRDFLVYTDTRTGETVDRTVEVGSAEWTDAWTAFLRAFESHVRERGWLDRTHLGFDERPASLMEPAVALLEKAAPDLAANGTAGAGSAEIDKFTYDLSLNYSDVDTWPQDLVDRRREEGKLTTFYTWANPAYPNTVTEAAPLGARVLPWQSAKNRFDGYLRWAYNSWPKDPYKDPSFLNRQGDEYLVYPGEHGPVSKIGWELFRDGQEDFALLDQLAERGGADNPVRREALDAVDPAATPGPEAHTKLLKARTAVIAELERLGGTGRK